MSVWTQHSSQCLVKYNQTKIQRMTCAETLNNSTVESSLAIRNFWLKIVHSSSDFIQKSHVGSKDSAVELFHVSQNNHTNHQETQNSNQTNCFAQTFYFNRLYFFPFSFSFSIEKKRRKKNKIKKNIRKISLNAF